MIFTAEVGKRISQEYESVLCEKVAGATEIQVMNDQVNVVRSGPKPNPGEEVEEGETQIQVLKHQVNVVRPVPKPKRGVLRRFLGFFGF